MHAADFEVHPAAAAFSTLEGEPLRALAEDIGVRGLRTPILLRQGSDVLIDGRARLAALTLLGWPLEPSMITREPFADDAAVATHILARQLERQRLRAGQRALLASRVWPLFLACAPRPTPDADPRQVALTALAEAAGVSTRTLERALEVADGAPALIRAVEAGSLRLTPAARLARHPPDVQERLVGLDREALGEALQVLRRGPQAIEALEATREAILALLEAHPDSLRYPEFCRQLDARVACPAGVSAARWRQTRADAIRSLHGELWAYSTDGPFAERRVIAAPVAAPDPAARRAPAAAAPTPDTAPLFLHAARRAAPTAGALEGVAVDLSHHVAPAPAAATPAAVATPAGAVTPADAAPQVVDAPPAVATPTDATPAPADATPAPADVTRRSGATPSAAPSTGPPAPSAAPSAGPPATGPGGATSSPHVVTLRLRDLTRLEGLARWMRDAGVDAAADVDAALRFLVSRALDPQGQPRVFSGAPAPGAGEAPASAPGPGGAPVSRSGPPAPRTPSPDPPRPRDAAPRTRPLFQRVDDAPPTSAQRSPRPPPGATVSQAPPSQAPAPPAASGSRAAPQPPIAPGPPITPGPPSTPGAPAASGAPSASAPPAASRPPAASGTPSASAPSAASAPASAPPPRPSLDEATPRSREAPPYYQPGESREQRLGRIIRDREWPLPPLEMIIQDLRQCPKQYRRLYATALVVQRDADRLALERGCDIKINAVLPEIPSADWED